MKFVTGDRPVVVLHPRGFAALWGPYETNGRSVESLTDDVSGISADEASRALLRALDDVSSAV